MKKIIKREKHRSQCGLITPYWVFTLECGHTVKRGGYMNGGETAYFKAEGQKKAKCPICEPNNP